MARMLVTPVPGQEGIYVANTPFAIDTTTIFRCEAIRTFPELIRKGVDVFTEYYHPVGLDRKEYNEDAALGVSIVTLKSVDGQIVYLPNSFIASIPGQTGLTYQRNIIVADLGPVPGYVNVEQIEADIKTLIGRYIGVDAKMAITVLKHEGVFTDEEHIRMENLRKLNIRNHIPPSVAIAELQGRNAKLTELNRLLMEALSKGGIAPPKP